jgi:hypothetical protein
VLEGNSPDGPGGAWAEKEIRWLKTKTIVSWETGKATMPENSGEGKMTTAPIPRETSGKRQQTIFSQGVFFEFAA